MENLAYYVVFFGALVAIGFLLRTIFSDERRVARATRRYERAFNEQLASPALSFAYFTKEKLAEFKQRVITLHKVHWAEGRCSAAALNALAKEIEIIVKNPAMFLERKRYDPVDDSLLEEPVSVEVDHPIVGKLFMEVNSHNLQHAKQAFFRPKMGYPDEQFYQIRFEDWEIPRDVRVVEEMNKRALVSAKIFYYIFTDKEVRIH
ncbi:MAG: hypothetical protein WAV73_00705 [Candidatus Moraniibacteriota bacterium]